LCSVAADYPDAGTYAEYATIKSNLLARIPDNTSFDEAASLPLVCLTAMQVLAQPLWSIQSIASFTGILLSDICA